MEGQDKDLRDWDSRTRRLTGDDGAERLRRARVLVVGTGGVGGYAVEMLVRSGIEHLTLVDSDTVDVSNLNRQILALIPVLGKPKTEVAARRCREINPQAEITSLQTLVTPDNIAEILDPGFDYVLDCIDTVAPKAALICACRDRRIPIISSMGAGGRTDPSRVIYTDLWETKDDGLARAVRQKLKKMNRRFPLPVVASTERPGSHSIIEVDAQFKRTSYGTLAPVPATFGIFMAARVINHILNNTHFKK